MNAIVTTETERKDAARIKMLLSYGDKLTDTNAMALVAYSRLHGLDPFNGECFFLVRVDKEGKRTELGLHPGIKGLRKKAREQVEKQDPQAWYKVDYEIIDPKSIGLDPAKSTIAVKATLRDSISTGRWIVDLGKLIHAGFTSQDAEKAIGGCPVWIGYGSVNPQELYYIKQSPLQLARKRAEADATRLRFDLPFAETADEIAPAEGIDYVEAEFAPPAQLQNGNGNHKRPEAEILAELGFGTEPEPPAEIVIKRPSASTWAAWNALCIEAKKVGIDVPSTDPDEETYAGLNDKFKLVNLRMHALVEAKRQPAGDDNGGTGFAA